MNVQEKYKIALLEFFRSSPRAKMSDCERKTGITRKTIAKHFEIFGESYFRGNRFGRAA